MDTKTHEPIHAHDVMDILNAEPMSKEKLLEVLVEKGGPDPRFFACSVQDQSFEEILTFLFDRSKIEEKYGILHFTGQACNH